MLEHSFSSIAILNSFCHLGSFVRDDSSGVVRSGSIAKGSRKPQHDRPLRIWGLATKFCVQGWVTKRQA